MRRIHYRLGELETGKNVGRILLQNSYIYTHGVSSNIKCCLSLRKVYWRSELVMLCTSLNFHACNYDNVQFRTVVINLFFIYFLFFFFKLCAIL